MPRSLAAISLLVRDYDEAIAYFTKALRFALVEDAAVAAGKRWVVVAPGDGRGASLLLAKASTAEQIACIGRQAAGRVWLFLHTTTFDADYEHMLQHGVAFAEKPRLEPYGKVVVFADLYGNKWDLVERAVP